MTKTTGASPILSIVSLCRKVGGVFKISRYTLTGSFGVQGSVGCVLRTPELQKQVGGDVSDRSERNPDACNKVIPVDDVTRMHPCT